MLGYIARRSFETRLQKNLEFLFRDCGGTIIHDKTPRRNALLKVTTVVVENVQLTFSSGHTGFYVSVASKFHPHFKAPFNQFVSELTFDGDTDERYDLETFDAVLRKRLPLLQAALSEENEFATLTHYIETRNAATDAYAARLRASGIEPVTWETPVS